MVYSRGINSGRNSLSRRAYFVQIKGAVSRFNLKVAFTWWLDGFVQGGLEESNIFWLVEYVMCYWISNNIENIQMFKLLHSFLWVIQFLPFAPLSWLGSAVDRSCSSDFSQMPPPGVPVKTQGSHKIPHQIHRVIQTEFWDNLLQSETRN